MADCMSVSGPAQVACFQAEADHTKQRTEETKATNYKTDMDAYESTTKTVSGSAVTACVVSLILATPLIGGIVCGVGLASAGGTAIFAKPKRPE